MEKVSLYRKYRPHNFANLVGQEHVKTTLINALKQEQVAHAYIFSGPRGTGKTSTARLLAKSLNCSNLADNYEPCGECDFCKDISAGRLIDLIEIDAASNRGIDEIRDLKEKISFAPTHCKYKIYIIDEVHMLTNFAFNALLKTLEEPPAHAYFILATTELHKIPDTIISRCQTFDFKRIGMEDLVSRLKYIADAEEIEVEERALEIIAKYVHGGMRDAIGLLEQMAVGEKIDELSVQAMLGMSSLGVLGDFYACLAKKDTQAALAVIQKLNVQGADLKQFVHDFVNLMREKMLICVEKNEMRSVGALIKYIEIFQESQMNSFSAIPQLTLEIAVIKATIGKEKLEAAAQEEVVVKAEEPKTEPVKETPVKVEEAKTEPVKETPKVVKVEEPKAEPVKETPKVVKSEEPEVTEEPSEPVVDEEREHQSLKGEVSLDEVKKNWLKVLEGVNKPFVQRSLKNGEPFKVEGSKLTLKFVSNFHRDKVMSNEVKGELEGIMKNLFATSVILESVVDQSAAPVVHAPEESGDIPPPVPIETSVPEKDPSFEEALDIFGGTVI